MHIAERFDISGIVRPKCGRGVVEVASEKKKRKPITEKSRLSRGSCRKRRGLGGKCEGTMCNKWGGSCIMEQKEDVDAPY